MKRNLMNMNLHLIQTAVNSKFLNWIWLLWFEFSTSFLIKFQVVLIEFSFREVLGLKVFAASSILLLKNRIKNRFNSKPSILRYTTDSDSTRFQFRFQVLRYVNWKLRTTFGFGWRKWKFARIVVAKRGFEVILRISNIYI